jgi:hypothetical protein
VLLPAAQAGKTRRAPVAIASAHAGGGMPLFLRTTIQPTLFLEWNK